MQTQVFNSQTFKCSTPRADFVAITVPQSQDLTSLITLHSAWSRDLSRSPLQIYALFLGIHCCGDSLPVPRAFLVSLSCLTREKSQNTKTSQHRHRDFSSLTTLFKRTDALAWFRILRYP